MTKPKGLSRRRTLKLAAAATALPLVHIRTAGAAGKVTFAVWDHWVPAGNAALQKLLDIWSEKNKVEVKVDYITAIGMKINVTMAAEAQARSGHDIYAFDMWTVQEFAEKLVPMDDVMKPLLDKYGPTSKAVEYLGKVDGKWMAVPVGTGSSPLTACARISMLQKYANIDVRAWYPDHEAPASTAADWTYETQLKAAEACAKGGFPFALGCGTTTDSVQTWGATFGAFGADLINAKGDITVDTDNVRAALDYAKRIIPFLPPDSPSFDDASNNRALISGKASLIWNPPSAWAVAKRDSPEIAADCWTFPNPRGPKGRLVPLRPYYWGVWNFAQNKGAAKELIGWLAQREQQETLTSAVVGYDIPAFLSMADFKIWGEVEPPKGTVFNYPVRPWHDAEYYITGSSGPPELAVQMWNRGVIPSMVAKMHAGQSTKQVMDWAKQELEGFKGR
jgi:ABC-type glycerol-3-phosphate transport system substrate-binding protein